MYNYYAHGSKTVYQNSKNHFVQTVSYYKFQRNVCEIVYFTFEDIRGTVTSSLVFYLPYLNQNGFVEIHSMLHVCLIEFQ